MNDLQLIERLYSHKRFCGEVTKKCCLSRTILTNQTVAPPRDNLASNVFEQNL